MSLRPTFSWTGSNDEDLYDIVEYTPFSYGTDPFSLTDIVPPAIAEGDNYSLSFDGEDDYGQIEYFEGLDISGDYTWMFDVFLNDTSNNAMFVENNSFYNQDGYYINYVDERYGLVCALMAHVINIQVQSIIF